MMSSMSWATKCGSIKRSWISVRHLTSFCEYGFFQNLAIRVCSNKCWVKLINTEFGAVRVPGCIHQQIAEDTVHQPVRGIFFRHLFECQFDFVNLIIARLIYARRLAGWPNEKPAEQIGQRWMIVPISDQTA